MVSSSTVQFDGKRPSISLRFVRAAGLASGAGIVARILQLLLPFIVAKVVSRTDYGIFTIVASTVAVGSELGQVGQGAALQKFVPQYTVRRSERVTVLVNTIVGIAFLCLSIMAGILFFTSRLVARGLYGDIQLANYLRIAAIILAGTGVFNVFAGVLTGLQDFGKYSFAQLIRSAALFLFGALGAAVFGLTGVLTAQIAVAILVALLVGQFGSNALRKAFGTGFTFQLDRGSLKEILGFSIPAFLAGILVLPAYWLAVTRLSKLFGLQEVAQFGIAFGAMQFVMLIPNMTSMTATSFLSESYARSDDTFRSLSNLNLRVAWCSALIIAVFLAFAAPQLLHVIFGEKYAGIQNVLQYMMLSGVAIAICYSLGSIVSSTGKMWHALALNSAWLAIFAASAIVMVPRFASQGLAVSYAGSYCVFVLLACLYANKICRVSLKKTPALTLLTIAGFAGAKYSVVKFPGYSAALGCAAALVLTACVWRFVLTNEEKSQARRKLYSLWKRGESTPLDITGSRRILYLCHVDWGWIKQRPQFLAEHLQEFFSVTVLFSHVWKRKQLPNRFKLNQHCLPIFRVPRRNRSAILARLDSLIVSLTIRLAVIWVRPTHIWLTWPEFVQYLPKNFSALLVYDCMDDVQNFPHDQERWTRIADLECEVVNRASAVFVSSNHLRDVLQQRYGILRNCHVLRNASDGKLLEPSRKTPGDGVFKIGYFGTIAQWCDSELLGQIVESRSDVEIHLVGPIERDAIISLHSRIIWHAPVRHCDLPSVVSDFDCLIMPFTVTPLIESVDPVKLYEYINFDKPIVSVFYEEIARFTPFVYFYRSHAEALRIISQLADGQIKKKYSDEQRHAFLRGNTWQERASLAAALLGAEVPSQPELSHVVVPALLAAPDEGSY